MNTLFKLSNPQPDPLDPGVMYLPVDYSLVLPTTFDPRTNDVPIENQMNEGDCTANGTVGSCGRFLRAQGKFVQLSEDFNYKTGLFIGEGVYPTTDSGSTPLWALKAAAQFGICTEATWPSQPSFAPTIPSPAAFNEALNYKATEFYRVATPTWSLNTPQNGWFNSDFLNFSVMYALAKGWTVQIAFSVGESIFSLPAGTVYQPCNNTNNVAAGGHEVEIVGWTTVNGAMAFIARNSWGPTWCDGGYFLISPTVLLVDTYTITTLTAFNGQASVGPDVTVTLPVPTDESTLDDILTYIYKNKFGRYPLPAGEQFWATAIESWAQQQIISGASAADKAYMAANAPSTAYTMPTGASTVAQVVTYIFQTYFGRTPLPAGEQFWAQSILAYFTTQVVAAAGAADKMFMAANGIS